MLDAFSSAIRHVAFAGPTLLTPLIPPAHTLSFERFHVESFSRYGLPPNLQVDGVRGVLDAYSSAIRHVALAGPTLFTPVIHTACEYAGREPSAPGAQAYYVLLIITDGVINDMDSTIGAIVHASRLPLSILIVGVGGADFSAMDVRLFFQKLLQSLTFSLGVREQYLLEGVYVTAAPVTRSREVCSGKIPLMPISGDRVAVIYASMSL